MAAKSSASTIGRIHNRQRSRNAEDLRVRESAPRAPEIPAALRRAVEAQRARLMDAEAILHCVVLALDASEEGDANGPYYQRVIDAAREKVATAIDQLDSVSLMKLFVKEPTPVYLH